MSACANCAPKRERLSALYNGSSLVVRSSWYAPYLRVLCATRREPGCMGEQQALPATSHLIKGTLMEVEPTKKVISIFCRLRCIALKAFGQSVFIRFINL